MEVKNEKEVFLHKCRVFTIETSVGILKIRKWWVESEDEVEVDFSYIDEESEVMSSLLKEDEHEDLLELINNVK